MQWDKQEGVSWLITKGPCAHTPEHIVARSHAYAVPFPYATSGDYGGTSNNAQHPIISYRKFRFVGYP